MPAKLFQINNLKNIFSLFLIIITQVCYSQISGSYQTLVNRPEAKGLNISIYVPDGWGFSPERDSGPISLSNSDESDIITINIQNAPTFYSRKMSKEFYQGDEYSDLLTQSIREKYGNAELSSHKIVSIDTYPALYTVIKTEVQSLEESILMNISIILINYEDYIISFGFDEPTPLINTIIKTIRFENEYK